MPDAARVSFLPQFVRSDAIITPYYAIVPCQVEHVYELVRTLRDKDRAEIENLGYTVKRALYRAYRNSIMCKTALIRGEVAAIWGLGVGLQAGVSPLSDMGAPWLHTSKLIEEIPVSFVRVAKAELRQMMRQKKKLESLVWADYKEAVKLLKILGFTVDKPEPVGLNGVLYSRFHMGF